MSEVKKGPEKAAKPQGSSAQGSGPAMSENCKSEDCKKKASQFGFCADHYELYMAGVIRGDGKKPSDYATKFARWQQQHKKIA